MSYPRHVHKPDGAYLVVDSEERQAQALADGWCLLPDPLWGAPAAYTECRDWTPGQVAESPDGAPVPKKRGRPARVKE